MPLDIPFTKHVELKDREMIPVQINSPLDNFLETIHQHPARHLLKMGTMNPHLSFFVGIMNGGEDS